MPEEAEDGDVNWICLHRSAKEMIQTPAYGKVKAISRRFQNMDRIQHRIPF